MYGLITSAVKKHKVFQYEALAHAINQTQIVNDIKARHLASTNKRLDVSAAEIAHLLHAVPEVNLRDKVCLEIGSGWVLSYAIIFYLLGAKKVYATDIAPLANIARLQDSVQNSTAYVIRDILSAFGDHEEIRARLDRLLALKNFNEQTLDDLGISYVAPFDFAQEPFTEKADFIFSHSVLNHLPRHSVDAILHNLFASLHVGGMMTHDIHLEDVKNFDTSSPFAFYEIPADEYAPEYDGLRGNRIRASEWERLVQAHSAGNARVYCRWLRDKELLPMCVDLSIRHKDKDDLRTSHLGIWAKRV